MLSKLARYNKFWMALVTVVVTGLAQVYGQNQWVQLLVAVAGSLGVFVVPNKA